MANKVPVLQSAGQQSDTEQRLPKSHPEEVVVRFGPALEPTPSENLQHFTNRVNELDLFRARITAAAGSPLPILMFYGVGGAGKTWLIRKMQEAAQAEKIPAARIDFDERQHGAAYHANPAAALADLRTQLDVSCPRFELAYAMMLHKQGAGSQPEMRHAETAGDLIGEFLNAALTSIPGGNVLVWFGKKIGAQAARRLGGTPLGKWLASKAGNDDLLALRGMTAQDIYPTLVSRLATDLADQLPRPPKRSCRAVLIFDTFEHLRRGRLAAAQQFERERWIADLWAALHRRDSEGCWRPFLQFVLAGRDCLTWPQHDRELNNPEHLEQHLVGGLSRSDAIRFFGLCGITDAKLQDALLASCVDTDTPAADPGYHAFKLGLFADAVLEERRRGVEPDPQTYRLPPDKLDRLIHQFLQSLADDTLAARIHRLALTPRFDEAAGRANFVSPDPDAADVEWTQLLRFSFVQPTAEPGWWTLHPQMRDGLRLALAERNPETEQRGHSFWVEHWSGRSAAPTDALAGLAWYHGYCLAPEAATEAWMTLAERLLSELRMVEHFELLDWWTPTEVETDRDLEPVEARALGFLGSELLQATLGNRASNVQRAIACLKAALRVYTETTFPEFWAGTQHNLGLAYFHLPTGDRTQNLRATIACYEAALRVHTEAAFPQDWATTQNNLGNAYHELPTGDRTQNLQDAIVCYKAALRVYKKTTLPQDWAMTQNNLGLAYQWLTGGDRAESMQHAITCYKAALRVYTETAFPEAWATTKSNLGDAYRQLPTGERAENLQHAIACYKAALRVRTETTFPRTWATTQSNLGGAYHQLPTGDRTQNLRAAIACYEAALRVCTETTFPRIWALTQHNLGHAHRDLDQLAAARLAFAAASRGFRAIGLLAAAQLAEGLLAELEALSPPSHPDATTTSSVPNPPDQGRTPGPDS